jgi:predicted dehydrogenase
MSRRSSKSVPSRRDFLKQGAFGTLAGLGFWVSGRGAWASETASNSLHERLNIGLIAVGGRAAQSMAEEDGAITNQNVVAICDVDEKTLARAADKFPKAAKFRDFRKLLDQKDIDAVMVSTPDHTHASATMLAIESGRHVYCEKPLAHTVEEARRVAEAAAKHKRVTQMGTQIHAGNNYRRVVELVRAGAIGPVKEVHVFCGKRWAGGDLPTESPPVPKYLDYDLWLGPVPFRPYQKQYHPESWRGYWAFGNGTLGDMACHFTDLPFWALELRHPTHVSAEGPPVHPEGCPDWLIVHWEFPERGDKPPVKLSWYDGGKLPDAYESWEIPKKPKNGVVFIGSRGILFADYDRYHLLPEIKFNDFTPPPKSIPDSIGHHHEWIAACKKNDPTATTCNFDYSGALSETVLLGAVAYRTGKPLKWDAETLQATNAPEAQKFIRGKYRTGWGL